MCLYQLWTNKTRLHAGKTFGSVPSTASKIRVTMRSTRDMLKLDSCIRTLRTSAIIRQASPSSKPPPMAYNIFDREAKRLQRSRAALRRPVNTSGSAYEDMSRRGEVSRLTDYVRDIGAMNLAERLLVRN